MKQPIISQSSTEVEYHTITSITKEIVWLRWLLIDIRVSLSHLIPMYCDNQSSIQIPQNSVFHERTKYIEIDCLLLVIISSMTPLLCHLFLLLLLCGLQIFLPSCILFPAFVF